MSDDTFCPIIKDQCRKDCVFWMHNDDWCYIQDALCSVSDIVIQLTSVLEEGNPIPVTLESPE
jgi:hypothetical protein